jgi:hypothetical protein
MGRKWNKAVQVAAKHVDLVDRVEMRQAEARRTLAVNRAYGVTIQPSTIIRKVS